jgi:hypothetical protein
MIMPKDQNSSIFASRRPQSQKGQKSTIIKLNSLWLIVEIVAESWEQFFLSFLVLRSSRS